MISRINFKTSKAIEKGLLQSPVIFVVFDVIQFKGKSIIHRPLIERNEIIQEKHVIKRAVPCRETGKLLYIEVVKLRLEGVVAKSILSKYCTGISI